MHTLHSCGPPLQGNTVQDAGLACAVGKALSYPLCSQDGPEALEGPSELPRPGGLQPDLHRIKGIAACNVGSASYGPSDKFWHDPPLAGPLPLGPRSPHFSAPLPCLLSACNPACNCVQMGSKNVWIAKEWGVNEVEWRALLVVRWE